MFVLISFARTWRPRLLDYFFYGQFFKKTLRSVHWWRGCTAMQVGRRSAVVLRKSAAGQHKQGSDPHHFLSLFFSFFVFFAFSFLLFAYLFSRSTLNRLRVQGVLVLITDRVRPVRVRNHEKKNQKSVKSKYAEDVYKMRSHPRGENGFERWRTGLRGVWMVSSFWLCPFPFSQRGWNRTEH